MSKSSEAVKRWRRNTKERIVQAFGGKCGICGYKRCHSALSLHHLDPNVKEMGLGGVRANPKSWKKIVEEIRKCVLLCHNCHSEVHDGLVELPKDIKKFDESFETYKEERKLTPCPVCKKDKPETQITCSLECAARRSRIVDWDKVDLIKERKTKSWNQIGEELNVSGSAVRKRAKKIGIL